MLEQKYQEEVRLYQMQLAQKNKEVEQLRGKLALLPEKRAEIAKHLQKVMENQWNEALKMIGERSSPLEVTIALQYKKVFLNKFYTGSEASQRV